MSTTLGPAPRESRFDTFARRMNLYTATVVSACTLVALFGMLSSRAVERATRTLRDEQTATRVQVEELKRDRRTEQRLDSLRFERTMAIVELAVSAIVEPAGSQEKREALTELRRKRRISPRSLEE